MLEPALVLAVTALASGVDRARLTVCTLVTASTLPAEVGATLVVGGASLTKTVETLGGALVVDADIRDAALVLVAVLATTLNLLADPVTTEEAGTAIRRSTAVATLGGGLGLSANLVDTRTGRAAVVLVARRTTLLDDLADSSVAVVVGGALVVARAVEAGLAGSIVGNTLSSLGIASEVVSAVAVGLAARTGSLGGGGSLSGGGRNGSLHVLSSLKVDKGRGEVFESLTVDQVSRDGLSHLESHEGGGGEDESRSDRSAHVGKVEVATLTGRKEDEGGEKIEGKDGINEDKRGGKEDA